jgi:hypothetical protein
MNAMMGKRCNSSMGQRMAVALVTLGLGSVIFGLVGFKKHQRRRQRDRAACQPVTATAPNMLGPDVVNPSERMARWNLLVWTGVGFSYFGVSLGVAAVMMARNEGIEKPASLPRPPKLIPASFNLSDYDGRVESSRAGDAFALRAGRHCCEPFPKPADMKR